MLLYNFSLWIYRGLKELWIVSGERDAEITCEIFAKFYFEN